MAEVFRDARPALMARGARDAQSDADSRTVCRTSRSARWRLPRLPKYSADGVARAVRPEQTIRRVTPLLEQAGVTRVGEVTYLDRVGIPNFVAVRPRDMEPGISYYNGKGSTRSEARAGAMMEAIERYSGERCDLPVFVGSHEEIGRLDRAVDPGELVVPGDCDYHPGMIIEWVEGWDLIAGVPTFLPRNSVVCPYAPSSPRACCPFFASTNGLAAGNSLAEALSQALCEVMERDAEAISYAEIELGPAVDGVLGVMGLRNGKRSSSPQERYPMIATDDLPLRARRLVGKIRRAGLAVYLRDLTSAAGIATIDCSIFERYPDGGYLVHGGCGTHPDARVALMRALTEAAQSRVGCIQGGREDLPELVRPGRAPAPEVVFARVPARRFKDVCDHPFDRVDQDVQFLLRRMRRAGLTQAVAVDLTRPELGVPVVRVVVPRAETWTIFQSHASRGVLGPRAAAVIKGDRS